MKVLRSILFLGMLAAGWGAACGQTAPVLRFDQRLGDRLALQSRWTDETGRAVTLREAWDARQPAVVVFGYYKCAQLCSLVERGAVDALRELGPTVGRDFDFIYLSIDPTDTPEAARQERAAAARAYGRGETLRGWHYLTGQSAEIAAAARSAGFPYRYDPGSGQFAHPAGFIVVTGDGEISRYFFGVDFKPAEMAAALRTAGEGGVGTSIYNLVLECFQGGRGASRKERLIWDGLWAAVVLTLVGLGGGIAWMLRAERQTRRPA